jgi:hypothetical protein
MPQYSFLPFLQPFPIATRILTGLLITLSLGQVLLTGLNARFRDQEGRIFEGINENAEVPYLLCVPGAALPWYFWTFLTAGFVEIKPVEVSVCSSVLHWPNIRLVAESNPSAFTDISFSFLFFSQFRSS